ncbi:MAG: hypothetical protein QOH06_1600 [Acidobacteriota bacterium]|jgi:hypothetical protein|nr:hypothetical protein [Acidobacteriota bacterium]
MRWISKLGWRALAIAIAMGAAASAHATTLIRMGLEDLVASNAAVVVGEVLDAESRWNEDSSFIVTDVRIAVHEVVKGRLSEMELTVTLPGGTIGNRTSLIIGAAELVPGNSYVLFLSRMNLLRAGEGLAVRDLVQGAFDIKMERDGLRAVSQAIRHPLMPDRSGMVEPPGGAKGMQVNAMLAEIRQIAGRQGSRREVK